MPSFICSAGHCDATDHLFNFPSTDPRRDAWTRFVRDKRLSKSGGRWDPNSASRLCFRHFKTDDFDNLQMYKTLKHEAVR